MSKRSAEPLQNEGTSKKIHGESQFLLNADLNETQMKDLMKKWFTTDKGDTVIKQGQLISNPFKCCSIQNFLEAEENIEDQLKQLEKTLASLEMRTKNNDLYKFRQSDDLKQFDAPMLMALKDFVCGPFKDWVMDVTGIELNDTVDVSCSMYKHTDVLLCHDDELKGRRIAFVFYLVTEWLPEDGGALDLFVCAADGQPKSIVKSILPKRNSMMFFEVTPSSFHQVSEILSTDKVRLSVNGWFHGDPVKRPPPHIFPLPALQPPGFVEETKLYDWINASYLDMRNWSAIQKQFEEDSEIQLENFLNAEKYDAVSKALAECSFSSRCGPANLRHYQTIDEDNLPEILSECRKVLTSEAMFLSLSHMTGLSLHQLAQDRNNEEGSSESSSGTCTCEIRNWTTGNYTLIYDNDRSNQEYALDVRLTFNCDGWNPDMGGYVSYIARDDDEELMTVDPEPNALSIVYRDAEAVKFVKHVNSKCDKPFQDFAVTYYE